MNTVERFNLSLLESGRAQPEIAAVWKEWRQGGIFSDFSLSLKQRMTLSAGHAQEGSSPALLSVGAESFVAKCFGPDWARSAIVQEETPDPALERLASAGYHSAILNEPNYDIMSVTCRDENDRWMQLLYERLIVPLPLAGGTVRLIGCMTAPIAPIRWLPEQYSPLIPD
ncbi:MAG: hypothetical protein ABJQ71_10530 [Roseibium sp.]